MLSWLPYSRVPRNALDGFESAVPSKIITYPSIVPGQVHRLQEHSHVLVRRGRIPDLPGDEYRLIRKKLDLDALSGRVTARSKYGTKLNSKKYGKISRYFREVNPLQVIPW